MFEFQIEARLGNAKAGQLLTPHGRVKTPVFMPVGTVGSVKAVAPGELEEMGAEIVLGNTYHLYLRPGNRLVRQLGGLHSFMRWPKAMLTDSGGYQVSSLGLFLKQQERNVPKVRQTQIDEEGVTFWSHLDGSQHRMNAEKSIEVQAALGADIIMAFDEATPDRGKEYAREAMGRTHRWLERSRKRWLEIETEKPGSPDFTPQAQALFGIVQGGNYEKLRQESAQFVASLDLPGIAIGGGSIGQNPEETEENVAWVRNFLPPDKPVYLMGVGVYPLDIVSAVRSGADMFDCVAPTRLARMGSLYHGRLAPKSGEMTDTWFESEFPKGRLVINHSRFTNDPKPIDEACDCCTCRQGFSRAYLRHLFKSHELLYYQLASIHNLRFMIRLTQQLRAAILKG